MPARTQHSNLQQPELAAAAGRALAPWVFRDSYAHMEQNMERRLTILLPARLAAELERAADAREVTLSEFTRAALRAAVEDTRSDSKRQS